MPSILLHSTQGGSDKVYLLKTVRRAEVINSEYTYDVIYANGRRSAGATAGNKAKNTRPLSFTSASALMYELAEQKRSTKGYHEMGECVLCGAVANVKQSYETNKSKPKPVKPELVKEFAPTWYARTVALEDTDL